MPAHVTTLTDLGAALDPPVTRKAIDNWKRYFPNDVPQPKPDGRHDVAAWQAFMERMNRKNAGNDNATSGAASKSAKEWKADQEEHKARILKAKADTIEGKLLDRDEVTKRLGSMLTSFRKALDGIAPRVAKIISSKMDYERKVEIVQHEIDVAMRVMEAADTLAEP